MTKQLELSRRNAFFSDPFFSDLRGGLGGGDLERRLAEFSARSMGLSAGALTEAAHNIQVSASNDKFQIQLELPGFAPEDFSLKTKDDIVIVEAVHNTAEGSRKFTREFKMPAGVVREQLASTYSGKGILTVSAPRVLTAPEGAQISEAMKAQSQAFVTEDGTAVKKDEKASSQSIAAVTESPDGSTISSFKSTSSSSSSSTMMSSGGPMPGGLMMSSLGGGGMPSLMGGGGMPSLDMDGMMSKMMGDMGSMSMGSSSSSSVAKSSMVSSSFSSSSSSSSSSMMSSNMSSLMGGMGLPPMRGMEMMPPGLSFEEMASMPPTASTIGERPEYTVTSPPMSPPPPASAAHEMSHRVEQTEDYVPPTTETAEATVLLRVKDGDEYKLALNMQQFSPEDITIKLNGQELSIEATNGSESFKQKHVIPDSIDLDAMSSSFSSDGVLVIKAPKK